jgi:membrane protein implicated in regulation of membrane protease activity
VKKLRVGREKNVTEAMEGKTGIVTESIEAYGKGLVKVGGIEWTAVGESPDFAADKGTEVRILRVEGVKVVVEEALTD